VLRCWGCMDDGTLARLDRKMSVGNKQAFLYGETFDECDLETSGCQKAQSTDPAAEYRQQIKG
jgi:hypothetical protein